MRCEVRWEDDAHRRINAHVQCMARRDLNVLDAAERAADQINQLIDRPSGRRLINPNQLRRSVHSISANIAEGFGRGTGKDRSRMLRIARGETEETIQDLNANFRATRISAKEYWASRNLLAVIVKMLNALVCDG